MSTYNQAKATVATIHGDEIKIPSSSKWEVSEGSDYTQVCLMKPGHPLNGLQICMDWSQGAVRPKIKSERIESIIYDEDLIALHGENLMEEKQEQ